MNKVIIYGNTILSRMLFHDAAGNGGFDIAAFAVDAQYLDGPEFCGLPQIDVEDAGRLYPPDRFDMIAVLGGYSDMRARARHFQQAKGMGYRLRNYISHRADVSPDLRLGENNIIMGQTHIGLNGMMGDNNMIRQNVYLGHDFTIGSHCFIGPGCNIAGYCAISDTCYIAIGSTIINNTSIAEETLVGAGSVVIRHTEPYSTVVGNPARVIGHHREEGIRMRTEHG